MFSDKGALMAFFAILDRLVHPTSEQIKLKPRGAFRTAAMKPAQADIEHNVYVLWKLRISLLNRDLQAIEAFQVRLRLPPAMPRPSSSPEPGPIVLQYHAEVPPEHHTDSTGDALVTLAEAAVYELEESVVMVSPVASRWCLVLRDTISEPGLGRSTHDRRTWPTEQLRRVDTEFGATQLVFSASVDGFGICRCDELLGADVVEKCQGIWGFAYNSGEGRIARAGIIVTGTNSEGRRE